ncbi:protein FAM32A-like [Ruditapes philippinarum]|uniref:protein FAM32A-like n=1 Tax=Ruditapes philippinarum TaxID=129788 RepID=UPI00295BE3C1|nr:protein FAM32A-like [Ruditapes philippinarum]
MADYENVCRGSLKLKGVSDHKIKKKKKKKEKEKELSKMYENIASNASTSSDDGSSSVRIDKRTAAELAFEKAKEKKMAQQIFDKATKTHKERIMEFNQHLDNLTEHFDIPKVSWTK